MPTLVLPPDVEAVLRDFRTGEFTTVNKAGQPLTWPTLPYYHAEAGEIIVTASIAFPVKAQNARRYPQVSLLYSDPTGSGLGDPPAVLVQGTARVAEMNGTTPIGADIFVESVRRQPSAAQYVNNPIAQKLFTFYFQRIGLFITPQRIWVWPHRDFTAAPQEVEVRYVE